MISIEVTSELFLTAFRALPKKAREAVVERMLKDKEFMEDLIDVVILEQRRKEPSRSLDEYLKLKEGSNGKEQKNRQKTH